MPKIKIRVRNLENKSEKESEIELVINEKFYFGRSEQSQYPLLDPKLSRKHFSLIWNGQKLYVQDEESTNGTCLNGLEIKQSQFLNLEDRVEVGSHEISVLAMPTAPNEDTPVFRAPAHKPEASPIHKVKSNDLPDPSHFKKPTPLPSPPPQSHDGMRKQKVLPTLSQKLSTSPSPDASDANTNPDGKHQLDTMSVNFETIKDLFARVIARPKDFFEQIDFSGSTNTSLIYIGACTLILCLLRLTFYSPFAAITGVIWVLIASIVGAGIVHFFRNFLKIQGQFGNFLRFSSYAAIWSLPLQIVGQLSFGILSILSFFLGLYLIWVWYKVFRPNLVRALILLVASWFAVIAITLPLSLGMGLLGGQFAKQFSPTGGNNSAFFVNILRLIANSRSKEFQPKNEEKSKESQSSQDQSTSQNSENPEQSITDLLAQASPNSKLTKLAQALQMANYKKGESFKYSVKEVEAGKIRIEGALEINILQSPKTKNLVFNVKASFGGNDNTYSRELDEASSLVGLVGTAIDEGKGTDVARISNRLFLYRDLAKAISTVLGPSLLFMQPKEEELKKFPTLESIEIAGIEGTQILSLESFNKKDGDANKEVFHELALSSKISLPLVIGLGSKDKKKSLHFELKEYTAP